MKKALVFAVGFGLLGMATSSHARCVQDQYGNQYNFTVDTAHKYLYGTVTSVQGCEADTWTLIGSYTNGPLVVELTGANPHGDFDAEGCIAQFKLKGNYPNFAWYYADGYGAQESQFVECGAPVRRDPKSGGVRR